MIQPYSCRAIGALVSVAFGFLIIGTVIALATYEEECGSYKGVDCERNSFMCRDSHECYCPSRRRGSLEDRCEDTEWQWNNTASAFIGVFSILFWGCIIASIVMCVCRCIHAEDYERGRDVIIVPADRFPQGGKV